MTSNTIFVKGTSGNTVEITIYNSAGTKVVDALNMIEIELGRFRYTYTGSDDKYCAFMEDATSGRSMGVYNFSITTSGASPTPAEIADAVWDELMSGHTIVGSFGKAVKQIKNMIEIIFGD